MAQLPLDQAIPRFKANEERMDIFANGNDTTDFLTSDAQPVPSIRKFLKNKNSEINSAADGILAKATQASDTALQHVVDSGKNADRAETAANRAEQYDPSLGGVASQVNALSAGPLPVENQWFFMGLDSSARKTYWQTIRNWLVARANHTGSQTIATITGLADALTSKLNVSGGTGIGGFTASVVNDGTKSSGKYTPTPIGGNIRLIVVTGIIEFAAPTQAGDYTMAVKVGIGSGNASITMTGFTNDVDGTDFTNVFGDNFIVYITKIYDVTTATIAKASKD